MPAAETRSRLDPRALLEPHRPVLALALLAALLYLPAVWNRDIWNPDEPRYAEVARTMVARGDYILPHLNGEVYSEKPPLYFWLGIVAGALPGVAAVAGPRLVSAAAALGTLVLVFRIGRRLAGPRTGWLAALALSTSLMFVVHASSGVIDALLALLVTAAIACGMRARETSSPVQWAGFYLLAGLAVLTKGPVGLIVPGGVLILTSIVEDGVSGPRARHAVWGPLIIAGVVAVWVVPAILRGGEDYASTILIRQNLGRAYESWHHREPIQYFLRVFPGSFLPWIVFLPAALYGAARDFRSSRVSRLAVVWFVFTFLFFSLVSGKKTRYLLPLFPAASLLVAIELHRLLDRARRGGAGTGARWAVPAAALAALVIGAGVLLATAPWWAGEGLLTRLEGPAPDQIAALRWYLRMPGALALVVPGLAIAMAGAAALTRLVQDARFALSCCAIGLVALLVWAQWVGVPAANNVKSAVPLARAAREAIASATGAGAEPAVVTYREEYAGIFNLYLERDRIPVMNNAVRTAQELRSRPASVVIGGRSDLERLRAQLPGLQLIECRSIGRDEVCVASTVPR